MIDKYYWLYLHFREDKVTDILCPRCGKGRINIIGSFKIQPTKNYYDLKKEEQYDIIDLDEKFSGILVCNNEYCKDSVAVCGTAFPEPEDYDEETVRQQYFRFLNPEYFSPPLNIFPLKTQYPERVNTILKKSFSLFFSDSDACGNKIRTSIEVLLDELDVEKEDNSTDETKKIKLHHRIEQYKKRNIFIGELMLSIKWIGNYGSHQDSISRSDLLDAYEMIQAILDNLYDNHEKKMMEKAKEINENKKPASKIIRL